MIWTIRESVDLTRPDSSWALILIIVGFSLQACAAIFIIHYLIDLLRNRVLVCPRREVRTRPNDPRRIVTSRTNERSVGVNTATITMTSRNDVNNQRSASANQPQAQPEPPISISCIAPSRLSNVYSTLPRGKSAE